jgi:hypothetical protein
MQSSKTVPAATKSDDGVKREKNQVAKGDWRESDSWERLPSRSRPGETRYVNLRTQQSYKRLPHGAKMPLDLKVIQKPNMPKVSKKVSMPLPAGWEKVHSRSRPGTYSYFNSASGTRVRTIEQAHKENLNLISKQAKQTEENPKTNLEDWLSRRKSTQQGGVDTRKRLGAYNGNTPKRNTEMLRGSITGQTSPIDPSKVRQVEHTPSANLQWLSGEKKEVVELKPHQKADNTIPAKPDVAKGKSKSSQIEQNKESSNRKLSPALVHLAQDILQQVMLHN